MLKQTQNEPSKFICLILFIFPIFSCLPSFKHDFLLAKNLNHHIIIPFHKPYFDLQKKSHGRVFQQLWNHSFIFHSYEVIHSFVEFVSC